MKTQITAIIGVLLIIVLCVSVFVLLTQSPQAEVTVDLPVTVVDDAGRTVALSAYPDRLVSLAPTCTEIIAALGLQNKTVGVVTYSGYSTDIKDWIARDNIPTVGTFSSVNTEAVLSLQPDLVFTTGSYQSGVSQALNELGIKAVTISPTGFAGVLNDIAIVGNITGHLTEQQTLIDNMNSRAQTIEQQTANLTRPRVYVEYYFDGSGLGSYGSTSFVNDLIAMAGGVNVFTGFSGQYVTTSSEVVITANPQIIIISNGVMSNLAGLTPEVIAARPGFNETVAVQNNQIYLINENLITIGGPALIDGLEALAKVIHPETFNSAATA